METKSLKYWKIFAFILIALNIALIVILIVGRPPRPKEDDAPEKYIIEKLKFTSQQETEFNTLREAHHDSVMALQAEGKELRKIFFEGLRSESPSIIDDSLANKIAENQKQIELVTYDHFEKVKKICTPEQKIIFNDIIREVLDRFRQQKKDPR
jgi:periplasmic protein CpxP/Spy